MPLLIDTLKEEHLHAAAELVSARYTALRRQTPVLPACYENVDPILELLHDLPAEADGVIAVQDGSLVGFLLAFVVPEFIGKRSAYSPVWANAAASGHSRRIYEEMYTRLSARWVANGCFTHLISLMADDTQAIEAWNWLGFGLINVDAVRPLLPLGLGHLDFEVRQAGWQDARVLSQLGRALELHEAAAPTYWVHELEDFGETLNQPGHAAWVALEGEQVLGFIALEPGDACECVLLQDAKSINISGAFIIEAERGKGVAVSLLDHALAWAREQGYQRCSVDFESMNTLAARFWTRWFEPVSYSLMRSIDQRITLR